MPATILESTHVNIQQAVAPDVLLRPLQHYVVEVREVRAQTVSKLGLLHSVRFLAPPPRWEQLPARSQ